MSTASRLAVYVSCAQDRDIVHFELNPGSGDLRKIGVTKIPGTTEPSPQSAPLAVNRHCHTLYAVLRSAPFPVASFAIDSRTGQLALTASAILPATMPHITIDRTGRFLLAASYQSSLVSISPIEPDGRVLRSAVQIVDNIERPHCIILHPDNATAYVAAFGANEILQFRFDATTGSLRPQGATRARAGAGPRHLAFHPDGTMLYCINETDGTIDSYTVDRATGNLTFHQTISAVPAVPVQRETDAAQLRERQKAALLAAGVGNLSAADIAKSATSHLAADLHVTPNGRFLYGSERTHSTISAYAIDRARQLTHVGAFATENAPRSFAIDPESQFLVAAGQLSGRVSVHKIDPGGALVHVGSHEAGAGASWVEIVELEILGRG